MVFDARGHFTEPHTGSKSRSAPLRCGNYLAASASTRSPISTFDMSEAALPDPGRSTAYGAILFIEKEGFMPLFEAVQLARALRPRHHVHQGHERHGGAPAGRRALRHTTSRSSCCTTSTSPASRSSARCSGTPGATLQERNSQVIDLGLRLDDMDAEGLRAKLVSYGEARPAVRDNLARTARPRRRSTSC